MDNEDVLISVQLLLAITLTFKLKKLLERRKEIRLSHPIGRIWTRIQNTQENRDQHSWYHTLLTEAAKSDYKAYHNWTRMSPKAFNILADKISVSSLVNKNLTRLRRPISMGERLAITLRFYATGDNITTIATGYCIGKSTAAKIVVDTGIAIYKVLQPQYLTVPNTEEEWRKIAIDFSRIWNFPNCLGSIDGKHIGMQAPANSGSLYYNYKKFHSIILLALCDADYKLTLFDLGAYGREDPPETTLPYCDVQLPHCFVGDDAFPVKTYLMKPFPGRCTGTMPEDLRVFSYRLSRARRVIGNAFGILAGRWRIFHQNIIAKPENVEHYTKACLVLHNYLIATDKQYAAKGYGDYFQADGTLIEGGWRNEELGSSFVPLAPTGGNFSFEAKCIRDTYKNYFCSQSGSVPWQNEMVNYGRN